MNNPKKIIEEAFILLYPEKNFDYNISLIYSGRFKDYNANVRLAGKNLEFKLCKKWREVSKEIQIGLIQELLLKLFKRGKKQRNMFYIDLYNNFVRNIHIAVPKNKTHPILEESFNRINERYFLGMVEKPNLKWGGFSKSTLGSYEFKLDTITISKVFRQLDPVFLDFVMYHEILHKQHKFKSTGLKNSYHDKVFKHAERQFDNYIEVDKKLKRALRYARIKSALGF